MGVILWFDDCKVLMSQQGENTFDSIVTDPPYGLEFMGKEWDKLSGDQQWHYSWAIEALRVLKPGGHAMVFGGTRTHHRLMCALEDAGFEIRDVLMWVYGSGFPKSMDISKQLNKQAGYDGGAEEWEGWGTALKPAYEPIILCRKPISENTVALNVLKWGVGGLNIDGGRVGTDTISTHGGGDKYANLKTGQSEGVGEYLSHQGRFPANLIHDGSEEVLELLPNNATRFFYCAKASKSERGEGNTHPTVKPLALMRYLCRLITPPYGLILDPFTGSGTTLLAANAEGFRAQGIESSSESFEIAYNRLKGIL